MNDDSIEVFLNQNEFRFNWVAFYKSETEGETCLSQYLEDGTEHNFSHIDQDKLHFFALVDGEHFLGVNLEDGSFNINGVTLVFDLPEEVKKEETIEYKLEYFRRVTQTINSNEPASIRYFFGWRVYVGEEQTKYTRSLVIEPDDSISVVDKY